MRAFADEQLSSHGNGLIFDMGERLAEERQEGAATADAVCARESLYDLSCAAITAATQAVNFFAYGTCRNSLGPWAFDLGPSTPVTSICACGNLTPSIPMNGMVPPSPR